MNTTTLTFTYTGNGAAQTFNIGFIPDYIRVINVTDADAIWEWCRGASADGTAIKTTTAVAPLASNGITPVAGTPGSVAAGFTIGTDLSEAAKVHFVMCVREEQ